MGKINLLDGDILKKGLSLVKKGIDKGLSLVSGLGDTRSAEGSFVAVSDFHGYDYPLDKIKSYYLNEYDYIYILGDATDRGPNGDGTGSIELLRAIKELTEQYPGRVIYIPGNHDEFLVGAARNSLFYEENTARNGGRATLEEMDLFRKTNPEEFNNLISWLENLPLQRTHVYDGQKYVFAHAFFNQRLYDENSRYSLRDYFASKRKDSKLHDDLGKVLWFRKSGNDDLVEDCPMSDSIMVIGHTPVSKGPESYDLVDKNGRRVKVHCVDGGIAYDGTMLKYDGGRRPLKTVTKFHNDTSPKKKNPSTSPTGSRSSTNSTSSRSSTNSTSSTTKTVFFDKEKILNDYIVRRLYEEGSNFFDLLCDDTPNNIISDRDCFDVIMSYEGKNGFSYNNCSAFQAYSMYKKVVVFNLTLQKLMAKYNDLSIVDMAMSGFVFGGEEAEAGSANWITRDNDARLFAESLGVNNIKEVLAAHNCSSVGEYLSLVGDKFKASGKSNNAKRNNS